MSHPIRRFVLSMALVCAATVAGRAQSHAGHTMSTPAPASSGQAAFATLSEVVRLLEADSTTDWSRVNIEALRAHLIDMDLVTLRSRAIQRNVTGGVVIEVTGTGDAVPAIQRMVVSHSRALDALPEYRSTAALRPGGVRLTVVAEDSADAPLTTRIRSLGFGGLLTIGDHHARHHLALARGEAGAHTP